MNITIDVTSSAKRGSTRAPHEVTYFPSSLPIVSEYYWRQSRRLDGEVDAIWLDGHPQAQHRVRPVSLIERDAFGLGGDVSVIITLRPDHSHIRHFVPSTAVRDPVTPPDCFETDNHSSFDFLDMVTETWNPWWFPPN
jgi:hypothetical protein